MQPALSACQECQILESRYHADLGVYREALAKLEFCAAERYQPAQIEAEFARMAFEDARAILNNHVAAHGCGYGLDWIERQWPKVSGRRVRQ